MRQIVTIFIKMECIFSPMSVIICVRKRGQFLPKHIYQGVFMNTNSLTTESVSKLFFRYLIPAIMGTMVTSIYILADTIIIGKGIGIDAMAALNIVLPLFNIFFGNGQNIDPAPGEFLFLSLLPVLLICKEDILPAEQQLFRHMPQGLATLYGRNQCKVPGRFLQVS